MLGLRLPGTAEVDIEHAIADQSIVRTWPMRGTVHFVPPEDAAWTTELRAPRVIRGAQSVYRKAGLDEWAPHSRRPDRDATLLRLITLPLE